MRLPRTHAHPAKVRLTSLVFAYHVITAAIFFYKGKNFEIQIKIKVSVKWKKANFTYNSFACGTFFGIGRNPVGCLGVIVALLDPFF